MKVLFKSTTLAKKVTAFKILMCPLGLFIVFAFTALCICKHTQLNLEQF